jgi:hypothetical protein
MNKGQVKEFFNILKQYMPYPHKDLKELLRCTKCGSGWTKITPNGIVICDVCGYEIETVTSRMMNHESSR